jgi:hypothetical protein
MRLTRIPLDTNNRMFRIGFGKHDGRWFARIDVWFFGIRITNNA